MSAVPRAAGIGFVGLSGNVRERAVLERAIAYFETRGHPDTVAPAFEAAVMRFAGDDATRLAALDELLGRDDIGTIINLRGGYGITRLLAALDFRRVADAIDARGVCLVGQSDFTAFNLALLAITGRPSLTGPNADYFGRAPLDALTESSFWHMFAGQREALEFDTSSPACGAEGVLWGGNLTVLLSLLGTPYFPRVDGGILFVEDANEHPYRIERMLLQLQQAGVLERQSALLVGDVSNYRLAEHDAGYDLSVAIQTVRQRLSIPLVTGLPFGHTGRLATLPIGTRAAMMVKDQRARLQF